MLKIKKIRPMFTALITTMKKYAVDELTDGGLVDVHKQQGGIKEYQTVVAVGPSVRDIKVGDLVCINPSRFAVKKHEKGSLKDGVIGDNPTVQYNFDVLEIDGKPHLLLEDRDIEFIIEEYEEVDEPAPNIIKPDKKVIIPGKNIIV